MFEDVNETRCTAPIPISTSVHWGHNADQTHSVEGATLLVLRMLVVFTSIPRGRCLYGQNVSVAEGKLDQP